MHGIVSSSSFVCFRDFTNLHIVSNGNYLLTCPLFLAVVGTSAVALAYFIQVYNFQFITQLDSAINTIRGVNAASAFTDTLMATVLTYLLLKHRSGFKKTNSIINRLITYTIGTGLVTGLWSTVGLIGAVAVPDSLLYVFIDLTIAKRELSNTRGCEGTNTLFN